MKIEKQKVLDLLDEYPAVPIGLLASINALPASDDEWVSVKTVPLNVQVIVLDTMTGDVTNCTYIRQPDKPTLINRFYWMPKPPSPPTK